MIRRDIHQAGGLVVRRDGEGPRVLIVSGRRRRKHWLLPKGHVETKESAADAALREVEEEAGITGRLIGPAGVVVRRGIHGVEMIEYFLIEYTGPHAGGGDGRRVRWRRLDDAMGLLSARDTREIVRAARPWILGRPVRA